MAKKRIKQVTKPAVNMTPSTPSTPIDTEKSLKLIAAIANRLLEEGHWTKAAKVALSGDNSNG